MRVAALQYCATADWAHNRQQLEALLPQTDGARLILLPENFACYGGDYRRFATRSEEIIAWLQQQALKHDAWIVAGSLPLLKRPDGSQVSAPRVRTAQLVVSPLGKIVARYDKLHLFDVTVDDAQGSYRESAVFEPGDALVVTSIDDITCGLATCFDVRFATQALWLAQQGAELLFYPSAFTQVTGAAHWELLVRARAVETGCYVLAANLCGQHNAKRQSYGHSLLVDPWGQVVASLGADAGVLNATVDIAMVQRVRRDLPLLSLQKIALQWRE